MFLSYIVLIGFIALAFARKQSFTATGTLECHGKPANGQTVEMKFTDPLLKGEVESKVKTSSDGKFKISGARKARAFQNAYLWIEHKCDAKQRAGCLVITYIAIPRNYDGKVYSSGKQELSKNVYYNSCDDIDN